MAWISVHEQIIGGKLRRLAKEIGCSQNEALGLLVRFWLWGINNADQYGKIIGADENDVSEILAIGSDSRYSADSAVLALISSGWIDRDDDCLYIHDWDVWQKQWYKALEVREKDKNRKRDERAKAKLAKTQAAEKPEEDKGKLPTPKLKVSVEHDSRKSIKDYTPSFEKCWEAYPRKIDKAGAYKKYKARVNDGFSEEELYAATVRYADQCRRDRTEEKYIKHGKTFYGESTPFIDYLPQKESDQNGDDGNPYSDWS